MTLLIPTTVRTRFAPSPTGDLHIGAARTALFSWALARHFNGIFVLRIEDTDLNRSTSESVCTIIDSMKWLELDYDEGPIFQTQRLKRYYEVITHLLEKNMAYYCYCSSEQISIMRERQRVLGQKPRYDGTCRPEPGKILPFVSSQVRKPVVRFRNPLTGYVSWNDIVKGCIKFANNELDDLVILRSNNIPTYNFCAAVDDFDMQITHVIRGDDHINNTPRQINILKVLGENSLPQYGHIPMILDVSGQKLSKRHGAICVLDYRKQGYLSEALLNYLARQGWSYGNKEIFSMKQLCSWFHLNHLSKSPARFNLKTLAFLNNYYINFICDEHLEKLVLPFLKKHNVVVEKQEPSLSLILALFKKQAHTLDELAMAVSMFYCQPTIDFSVIEKEYITDIVKIALSDFYVRCCKIESWERTILMTIFNEIIVKYQLKTAQLAMPLRLIISGHKKTPAIDILLELFGRKIVLTRLEKYVS